MKNVYYVQRLQMPYKGHETNPFTFGGGLVRGGLSTEAMDLIKTIFAFDYMGAAEFEWGAVPSALKELFTLAVNDGLVTYVDEPVYIIAPGWMIDDVIKWVQAALEDEYVHRLKEPLHLKQALQGGRTQGWLKIEGDKICKEPFMFFTNEEMFDNMCQLLELTTKTKTNV